MKIGSTLIVGAGGIGTHLAEPLARLLHMHPNGFLAMEIVDGDVYEQKNADRQLFLASEIGKPKSLALAYRLAMNVPLADGAYEEFVDHTHGYINSDVDAAGSIMRVYRDGPVKMSDEPTAVLVCLCVDNDATRKLFYDSMAQLPKDHPEIVVLDCGNDLETSTVVASFWKERKSRLVSPVEMYENLRDPKDRVPGGGCMEQAPSTPQLMVANMAAAFSALLIVQALLDGKPFTDVVQANVRTFTVGVAGGSYGA